MTMPDEKKPPEVIVDNTEVDEKDLDVDEEDEEEEEEEEDTDEA
jgi:hypothetical protein